MSYASISKSLSRREIFLEIDFSTAVITAVKLILIPSSNESQVFSKNCFLGMKTLHEKHIQVRKVSILVPTSFEQEICFTEGRNMGRRIVMMEKTASPVNYLAFWGECAAVNFPEFDRICLRFVHCLNGLSHSYLIIPFPYFLPLNLTLPLYVGSGNLHHAYI